MRKPRTLTPETTITALNLTCQSMRSAERKSKQADTDAVRIGKNVKTRVSAITAEARAITGRIKEAQARKAKLDPKSEKTIALARNIKQMKRQRSAKYREIDKLNEKKILADTKARLARQELDIWQEEQESRRGLILV